LKDCPPFASWRDTNQPPEKRAAFEENYAKAISLENQNKNSEAIEYYQRATAVEPRMAEAQFHLGQCLLRLTNFSAAPQRLQSASDSDALTFRADTRINQIIREAAGLYSRVAFFEAAPSLEAASSVRICGQESFYEHVHFNFDGNYCLAL